MDDYKNLRYVVMLLNPGYGTSDGKTVNAHDGRVFCLKKDAEAYARESIKEHHCTRFAIALFYMEPQAESMGMTMVETFGFKNDHSGIHQLSLFQ